jgi:hypothetical protein
MPASEVLSSKNSLNNQNLIGPCLKTLWSQVQEPMVFLFIIFSKMIQVQI